MEGDIYELHKAGVIDLMARSAVSEDEGERKRREAEPEEYALTYDENRTVLWASNIFDTIVHINQYIETDPKTGLSVRLINPESTDKTIQAFIERGIDPDELYELAQRVLGESWYSLLLFSDSLPENGAVTKFSLVTKIDGIIDKTIISREAFPEVFNRYVANSEIRKALGLPPETKFLYSTEWDDLEILLTLCNPQPVIEERISYLSPYSMMPNAASFNLVSRFINNSKMEPKEAGSTIEMIDHYINEDRREYQVEITTRNSKTTLTVSNYPYFFFDENEPPKDKKSRRGNLSGVKKVWRFALQKLMQQSTYNMIPEFITIDLEEMVKPNFFSNTDNAYRGIETMIKKMTLLFIHQDFNGEKGSKRTQGGVLFYHADRQGPRARIFVNRQFGFEFFRSAYTYFPTSWAYQLDGNAFSITEYVFSLIRQNADKVTKKGKFEIKLSTLHNQLGLRSVEDVRENANRRYNDFIKKPIIQAINEVNEAAKKDKEIPGRFKITLKAPETSNIEEWLEGSIIVSASGEYAAHLTGIAGAQRQYIEAQKEQTPATAKKKRGRKPKS